LLPGGYTLLLVPAHYGGSRCRADFVERVVLWWP